MDWSDLTKLFLVGAFPWVSELKNLDIHFEQPGIKTSSIFNFFASLFAMGIFVYSYYVNPYQLIQLPSWSYFLLGACVLTIIFFLLFIYNRDKVKQGKRKGVVIASFIIYILVFCSLTTSFGLLKVFKDYVVIEGKVRSAEGKPARADFNVSFSNGRQMNFKSNASGRYTVMLKKNMTDSVNQIEARSDQGEQFMVNTFGEISVFNYLKEIQLIK